MTTSVKKKILQLCHGYDGPFLDCARQYASLFSGTEYSVTTVYLTGKPSEEVEQRSASDQVIFLNYSSKQIRGLKLGAICKIKRIVADEHFTLCIAHRFKPVYVALLATELPVIGVHHAFGDYKRFSRRCFVGFFQHRLMLLGVSNAVRDDIRKCLPKWPKHRIETLYNRVNVEALQAEQLSRQVAREQLGIAQDAWIVANVGRLHPDKDQATLIRGFAEALPVLPEHSQLLILGQGRLEKDLKALVTELGITEQVRFLGQIKDARRYFAAFDVFALSSDYEPFGMVLLEAMVAGVAVLATACGGAQEVVSTMGELFPLGDKKALAAVLVKMSQESPRVSAQELRDYVAQHFSDAAVSADFWALPNVKQWLIEQKTP